MLYDRRRVGIKTDMSNCREAFRQGFQYFAVLFAQVETIGHDGIFGNPIEIVPEIANRMDLSQVRSIHFVLKALGQVNEIRAVPILQIEVFAQLIQTEKIDHSLVQFRPANEHQFDLLFHNSNSD
jgi:hypothetical protein